MNTIDVNDPDCVIQCLFFKCSYADEIKLYIYFKLSCGVFIQFNVTLMNNQCKDDNKSLSKLQKYDSSHRLLYKCKQIFLKLGCFFFVLSDFSPANYLLNYKITRQFVWTQTKHNIIICCSRTDWTTRHDVKIITIVSLFELLRWNHTNRIKSVFFCIEFGWRKYDF